MARRDNGKAADAALKKAYRQLATEASPPDVDRRVLATAAAGLSGSADGRGWKHWLRPLAAASGALAAVAVAINLMQPGSEPMSEPARNTDTTTSNVFDSAADDAARNAADAARQAEMSMQESTSAPVINDMPSLIAEGDSITVEGDGCENAERADPASWWQCVRRLEAEGQTALAETELAELLARFPDFSQPQR